MDDSSKAMPENLELRIRRARSWLSRAEKESDDPDAAFVFYWIAFNAAYARGRRSATDSKERHLFDDFFVTILSVDAQGTIHTVIKEMFSDSVRMLLNNKWVYRPFWLNVFGMGHDNWEFTFENAKRDGLKAVVQGDTREMLNIIFDRLYDARNQIMHGGARWKVGRNRKQVRDGTRILAVLVPLFVDLMEANPNVDWGLPEYRFVGQTGGVL